MQQLGRAPGPYDAEIGSREHAALLTEGRNGETQQAMQWLAFTHLPHGLIVYARPFYATAIALLAELPDSRRLTYALSRLRRARAAALVAGAWHNLTK